MNNNIKVIKTNKYKNINLYLRYTFKYDPNLSSCAYLLCKLIGNITEKYDSKQKMSKVKDMLFNIGLDVCLKPRRNYQTLCLHYSFLNPKFVDVDIRQYNDFILETLNNSLINEESLSEAKISIVSSYLRELDKPSRFAYEKVIKLISDDQPGFDSYVRGDNFSKKINSVSINEVKKAYKYIINKARLDVYLCGDVNSKDTKVLTDFNFNNRLKYVPIKSHINFKEKKNVLYKKDISQSSIYALYSTPYSRYHKDYFAWMMANCVLGSCPSSLLFSQIREKKSLCYSIYSSLLKAEGLVMVITSIDGKNKNLTLKEINKQIDRLKNKDYDKKIIDVCRNYMIDSFKSVEDDIDSTIDFLFENKLNGLDYSINYICKQLLTINEDDIAKIIKNYKPYFNYVLIGTKHE